jgi:hypothetical protein
MHATTETTLLLLLSLPLPLPPPLLLLLLLRKTHSRMVPVQLDPDRFSGPKRALQGQGVGGTVLQVRACEVDTKLSLLSLQLPMVYTTRQNVQPSGSECSLLRLQSSIVYKVSDRRCSRVAVT